MRMALIALLVLSGCATPAVAPLAKPMAAVTCIPLPSYSIADQKAMGDALSALDRNNPLVNAIRDYEAMRDADRACLAQQGN